MEKNEKILLITMPFLTPLIPPVGISCLKSYLSKHGYTVMTHDVMSNLSIRELCYRYFQQLEDLIPLAQQGFFFNIGLDVLMNHFMAHINHTDTALYYELIKELVYKNFYTRIEDKQSEVLIKTVTSFYQSLEEHIIGLIKNSNPSIVGFSVYKGTLAATVFAGKIIATKYPNIKIIMGGTIFAQDLFPETPNYNAFIKIAAFIDKIFIGESELLFLKYLKGELDPSRKFYTLHDIDNQVIPLDSLDIPDYSDFDLETYPLLPTFTSRGCIYRCSFCAETVYWKKYHRKSAQKVVEEFAVLSQKYKKNIFVLTDSLINPIIGELSEELIRTNLHIYWDVYLKIDDTVCNAENVFLWRKAGFYRARIGVESGSQAMLDRIDKKISLQQTRKAIMNLANAGIKTSTYWIAGHPGETEEDFQLSLALLEELQDYLYEAECDPFRFFYRGQVHEDKWNDKGLLYDEAFSDLLVIKTWECYAKPARDTIYERNFRFKEKCRQLGIPNPYALSEIIQADNRWEMLHKNAVPGLMKIDSAPGSFAIVDQASPADNKLSTDIAFTF